MIAHLITLSIYLLAGVSQSSANFLTAAQRVLLATHGAQEGGSNLEKVTSIRTLLSAYRLNPKTMLWAYCPRCYTMHSELPRREGDHKCLHEISPGVRCTERLNFRTRGMLIQSLIDWIGRMLSRPHIEAALQAASYQQRSSLPVTTSVLDANVARSLTAVNGQPFLPSSAPDLHLLFSLNSDGFNPYGMKPAGSHYQTVGVYMALLSLPPNLRHRPENIFMATLAPGPKPPKGEAFNGVLKPIVDDLCQLWNGVKYSKTTKFPQGRLVRAAVGCLVNDLPAAHDIVGVAPFSREEWACAFCLIPRSTLEQYDVLFPLRDPAEIRDQAQEWLMSGTAEDRERYYALHGVRFSELSRLPYLDLIGMKTLDGMHAFFLGMLQRAIKELLGFDSSAVDASQVWCPELSDDEVALAEAELHSRVEARVKGLQKNQLVALCVSRGLRYAGSSAILREVLWVSLMFWDVI